MIWRTSRAWWNGLSVNQKITIGFGWVLGLLIFTAVMIHLGVREILDHTQEVARGSMSAEAMGAEVERIMTRVAGLLLLTIIFGLVMARLTARDISALLQRLSDTLGESSRQVGAAAGEISVTSQSLSDDASQQAAVAEETSASLAAMTDSSRETAALTADSERLMRENIEKSGTSLKALVQLTDSMTEIEQDSGKISQIITTIDSIAFQTNLLALNAAVEAARAGEAGAGFAVVADEVRNLARRSGEAARDIGALLETTVHRVTESAQALKSVNTDFEAIIESATAIGEKNSAVTRATEGLSQQIKQINEAMIVAGDSTQRIAACSEESAAAAAELTAQAGELAAVVTDLVKAVRGEAATD